MTALLHRLLILAVAAALAAGITYFPWMLLWRMEGGGLDQLFGMTAILWAPLALVLGLAAGALFAWWRWPRRDGAS